MILRLPLLSPVAWITVDRITQQVIWLILFAILAPILGPRPYGLFSIVMVFIGFCEFVLLEAAVEALVTVDELQPLHTSTANVVNGGIALALGLVLALLAPAVGTTFHDGELTRIVWALTSLPVLTALSATPVAILRRELQYKKLALRSIGGLILGGSFGLGFAVAGAGVWALVIQILVQRLAELLIVWISIPARLSFKWSRVHFQEIRSVGVNVVAAGIMIFTGGQFPRIVLGYVLGPTEVGLFVLANRFLDIITHTAVSTRTAVGRIELRDTKLGSAGFAQIYERMTQTVSVLAFPLFLGAAVLVPGLFRVWLDQRWAAGVIPTQLLLITGLPMVIFYCIDAAFLGANLSSTFKKMAAIQAISIIVTVIFVVRFGLEMTCLALALRAWIFLPILLVVFRRSCHMRIYGSLRKPLRSLVGAIIMAASLDMPFLRPPWLHTGYDLVGSVIAGVGIYIAYLYWFARDQLREFLDTIWSSRSI